MLSSLIKRSLYYHLKFIHQTPNGIQNRFKGTADKWVQSLNHPHVKTYYEFNVNKETNQYDFKNLNMTEQEESHIKKVRFLHKPALAQMSEFFRLFHEIRPDDYQLTRDVQELTTTKFIRQGRQQFTQTHEFALNIVAFIILHIALYFIFVHGKELPQNERIKVLNAEIVQSYQFTVEQANIKVIKQRMDIVNKEYQKQLSLSKSQSR